MAAAVAAYEAGIKDVLILERDESLGGILKQCIHNGFGLHTFKEELTGPEYAYRYERLVKELNIPYKLNTMVLDVTEDKVITATNSYDGIFTIQAKAIILAMGCRERSKGALNIAGSRPAGIYSAGTAQKFVNIDGYMPGKEVVILGSGDIGLIMARRMTLEGAKVKAVCELMPYSGGLARNIEQCLNDFNIPLKLSHTVIEIHGQKRLEGVTIAQVDERRKPILSTKEYIPCDTLLLSVGLIPENELTKKANVSINNITNGAYVDQNRETNIPGIFACGNVLHVHDLVDFVSEEAEIAGKAAAKYINNIEKTPTDINITVDGKIRYTVPSKITEATDVKVYFRVADVYRNIKIVVKSGDKVILEKKKAKVAPGEMEAITLKEKMLSDVKQLSFSLEVL
jgi:sarcosine oxidase subunit alpha